VLRAVLDANIIISALIQPKGASGQILTRLLEASAFELIVSPAILTELRRSL
jgi:predicted nucleic acid-binding protein